MSIATIQHENEIVLVVRDGFDAKEADELHELLLRLGSGQAITVDFRAVRRIEDFVMARLAGELARGPLHVIGLSRHQSRAIRADASRRGAEEASRFAWFLRAIVVALLLGAAAGVMAASFVSLVEAEGLEIPFLP
jgi:hypothetical protein